MLKSLRNRLLLSYVAILLVTLGFIGLALLVFLRTRPLPTDEIVRDLTANLLDVRVREAWELNFSDDEGLQPRVLVQISTYLETESANRNLRTIIVDDKRRVYFDSAGAYVDGEQIANLEGASLLSLQDRHMMEDSVAAGVYEGEFTDPDGSGWIFVAQPLRLTMFGRMQGAGSATTLFLLVAEPVPRPSLPEVFNTFGDTFIRPLFRAGLVGLLIAIMLAALIARSVARPLQRMSAAALRIAQGDFRHRVPVRGPQEVRALAHSFNEMTERVSLTQQAQRDFLANVSHDLRTPLTSIQGFSQAILDGVAADPEMAQHAAQVIYDEAGRLHRMVEGLLDMARIEAGQLDMLRRAVRVGEVLQAVTQSLSVKAHEKGVNLNADFPADLPRVAGDGDRLAQVFTNLIDNAIKHTPAGGTVTVEAEVGARGLQVAVRDTGEGIPAEDLPRIFERFYQVDKSRQHKRKGGMGLGLAITRQIVEAHGGKLQVASRAGEGSVFTVWLPLPTPDMSTVVVRGR